MKFYKDTIGNTITYYKVIKKLLNRDHIIFIELDGNEESFTCDSFTVMSYKTWLKNSNCTESTESEFKEGIRKMLKRKDAFLMNHFVDRQ